MGIVKSYFPVFLCVLNARYDVKIPINVDISMFCVFTGHNLVIEI